MTLLEVHNPIEVKYELSMSNHSFGAC